MWSRCVEYTKCKQTEKNLAEEKYFAIRKKTKAKVAQPRIAAQQRRHQKRNILRKLLQ